MLPPQGSGDQVPRWLWIAAIWGLAAILAVGLGLVIALSLGWNNPRPSGPPDWVAADLPRRLRAPTESVAIELVDYHQHANSQTGRFVLQGIARPIAGPEFNGYGFAYRAQDPGHYTVFAVGSDGYYAVLRFAADEEAALVEWQQFPHIRRAFQANRLRVECTGPTCDFYINDEFATTVEDDAWSEGDFGLWARSFGEAPVEVEFTTCGVWTP